MAKKNEILEWDIESLRTTLKALEQEQETLQGYWAYIDGLRRTAAEHWQSPAGVDYQSRMQTELVQLSDLLEKLQKQIDATRELLSNCYQTCETKLAAAVRSLRSKMR